MADDPKQTTKGSDGELDPALGEIPSEPPPPFQPDPNLMGDMERSERPMENRSASTAEDS